MMLARTALAKAARVGRTAVRNAAPATRLVASGNRLQGDSPFCGGASVSLPHQGLILTGAKVNSVPIRSYPTRGYRSAPV